MCEEGEKKGKGRKGHLDHHVGVALARKAQVGLNRAKDRGKQPQG